MIHYAQKNHGLRFLGIKTLFVFACLHQTISSDAPNPKDGKNKVEGRVEAKGKKESGQNKKNVPPVQNPSRKTDPSGKTDATTDSTSIKKPSSNKSTSSQSVASPSIQENSSASSEKLSSQNQASGISEHLKNAVGAQGYIDTALGIVCLHPDVGPAVVQEISVKEGDSVDNRQVVARLSTYAQKEAEVRIAQDHIKIAEQDKLMAENENDLEEKKYQRSKEMKLSRVISTQEFDERKRSFLDARIKYEKAKIALSVAQGQLDLAKIGLMQAEVRAPIDGTILLLNVKAGERVRDDGILFMADLKTIEIVAEVHEQDISKISVGQKAEIALPHQNQGFIGQVSYVGGIVRSNRLKDSDPKGPQDLRVVEVRIKLSRDDAKKVERFLGMHVDVRFLNEAGTEQTNSGPKIDQARSL